MAGLNDLIDAAMSGGKPGPNAGTGGSNASALSHERIGREGGSLLAEAFSPGLTSRRERALRRQQRQNGGNNDRR